MKTAPKQYVPRTDGPVFEVLKKLAVEAAKRFGLPLAAVLPIVRQPKSSWCYGFCQYDQIHIAFREPGGARVFHYALLDTLSHELAHLTCYDHDNRWMKLHLRILGWLVRERDAFNKVRRAGREWRD